MGVITCRVYKVGSETEFTEAFKKIVKLMLSLSEYPSLNDERYSEKEVEATLENIKNEAHYLEPNDSRYTWPEDYVGQIYSWLSNNLERAIESRDGGGGYPTKEELTTAIHGLGWCCDGEYEELQPGDIIKIQPLEPHKCSLTGSWVNEELEVKCLEYVDTVEDDIEIEVEFQGKPRLVFGSQYIEIVKPYIISSNQMEFKYENEDNRNNQVSS